MTIKEFTTACQAIAATLEKCQVGHVQQVEFPDHTFLTVKYSHVWNISMYQHEILAELHAPQGIPLGIILRTWPDEP